MGDQTISWGLAKRIMALMPEHETGGFCRDCADANPHGVCSNREDGMPCDPIERGIWWAERQAKEIESLRARLAELEGQEPVAYLSADGDLYHSREYAERDGGKAQPLYTTPPPAPSVPDEPTEEILARIEESVVRAFNMDIDGPEDADAIRTAAESVYEDLLDMLTASPEARSEAEVPEPSLKTAIALLEGAVGRNSDAYADSLKPVINFLYEQFVPASDKERLRRIEAEIQAEALERLAPQWDGCMYEAPGMDIDIGESIRAEAARLREGEK